MSFVEWPWRSTIIGILITGMLAWVMFQTMGPVTPLLEGVCVSCGVQASLRDTLTTGALIILTLIVIAKTIIIVDFEGARA